MIGIVLATLGGLERSQGNSADGLLCLSEALEVLVAWGEPREMHFALEGLADLAYDEGRTERAVALAAEAATCRTSLRGHAVGPGLSGSCAWLDAAQDLLSPRQYAAAWDAGEALSAPESVALAGGSAGSPHAAPGPSASAPPRRPVGSPSTGTGSPAPPGPGVMAPWTHAPACSRHERRTPS